MELETSLAGARSVGCLKRVARYQRWVIAVVLGQLALWGGYMLLSLASSRSIDTDFAVALTVTAGGVGGVFVFLLSWELRGGFAAVTFGLATLVPVLGLFVLTLANGDATTALAQNGVPVGLFGADTDVLDDAPGFYDEDAAW